MTNVVAFKTISGLANPADLLTKHLPKSVDRYIDVIRAVKTERRAAKAAQLHHPQRKIPQFKAHIKNKDSKHIGTLDRPPCMEMDDVQCMCHVNDISENQDKTVATRKIKPCNP